MKKIVLTLVAMLSMTAAFAENEKTEAVNYVQAYDMNINMNSLAQALGLSFDQQDVVEDVNRIFNAELKNAAVASTADERKALFDKAVAKDLKNLRAVLSDLQYRKYVMLLNVTFTNRGVR